MPISVSLCLFILSLTMPSETTIVASKVETPSCDKVLQGLSDQNLRRFAENPELHRTEYFAEEAKDSHEIAFFYICRDDKEKQSAKERQWMLA